MFPEKNNEVHTIMQLSFQIHLLALVFCCPISDHVIIPFRILDFKCSNSRVYMNE